MPDRPEWDDISQPAVIRPCPEGGRRGEVLFQRPHSTLKHRLVQRGDL
jgi:hypothetical protein